MLRFVFSYVLMMCVQLSYLEKKRSLIYGYGIILYCMTTDLAHVLSMPIILYRYPIIKRTIQ